MPDEPVDGRNPDEEVMEHNPMQMLEAPDGSFKASVGFQGQIVIRTQMECPGCQKHISFDAPMIITS